MLDSLCIIFMTGYFGYNDNYHPIPKETTRIEIKTKKFRTLLLKIDEQRWFGNVNGKIFFSDLDNFTSHLCKLADKEPLPPEAYKERSILIEN
jgi:hypothetical protein